MYPALFRPVFVLAPTLLLVACSHQPVAPKVTPPQPITPYTRPQLDYSGHSGIFPKPIELETQVAFWRNVYAVWGRSQVAIHDDRYLDVIYEILEIPNAGEVLSADQKAWVADRRNYWQSQLSSLENKLALGQPLSGEDHNIIANLGRGRDIYSVIKNASQRVRSQRGTRERFLKGLHIGSRYEQQFRKIFRNAGLPEDLAYLPHVESSFQAAARSSAGAVGIWQFTRPAAEKFMNMRSSGDPRLDPVASTHGAARYLSHAYGQIGNWPMAITSYNHGINGMKRAKGQFGHDFMNMVQHYNSRLFGFASRNYYAEFLAAREIATQPERYFAEFAARPSLGSRD